MDAYCPYPPKPRKVKELTAVNLLLASITVFIVLDKAAEETQAGAMALCALISAAIMVVCAIIILITYQEDDFTEVSDILINICCSVQMIGIVWRMCTQTLDTVALGCTLISALLLGAVTAYLQQAERDEHRCSCDVDSKV